MDGIPSTERNDIRLCPHCGLSLKDVQSDHCPRCGQALAAPVFQGQGGQGLWPDAIENLPTVAARDLAPFLPGLTKSTDPQTMPPTFPNMPPGTPHYGYQPSSSPSSALGGSPVPSATSPSESPSLMPAPAPHHNGNLILIVGALIALVVILASALVGVFFVSVRTQQPTNNTSTPPVKILYQKSFSTDATGWAHDSNCSFQSHAFHVLGSNICYAPTGSLGDATISVISQQVAGSLDAFYGLVLRRTDRNNYYEFEVNSKGKWRFAKLVNGAYRDIISSRANNAINPGLHALNTLQVRMKGSLFTFFINEVEVGSVADSSFSKGSCGIRSGGDGIEAAFNNFLVLAAS